MHCQPSVRRQFLKCSAMAGGWLTAGGGLRAASVESTEGVHRTGQLISSPKIPVPSDKREPLGWFVAMIGGDPHSAMVLDFAMHRGITPTHFRLCVGLDQRGEQTIEVAVADTGRVLGTIRIRYACMFQPYQIELRPADAKELITGGVRLRLLDGEPLGIFTGRANEDAPDVPAVLRPHLLVPSQRDVMDEFYKRMDSLGCVQQFGWMEGCVLDGLVDLGRGPRPELIETARRHLNLYFNGGRLKYLNSRSRPVADRVSGIESSLPFAALARLDPDNPTIELALEMWRQKRRPTGSVQDGATCPARVATRLVIRWPKSPRFAAMRH